MSYYIHHVPGRLRIRTARLHRAECQAKLGKRLGELPGIDSYSHNAKAGSVLIHYDAASLSADDILYHIRAATVIRPRRAMVRRLGRIRAASRAAIRTSIRVGMVIHPCRAITPLGRIRITTGAATLLTTDRRHRHRGTIRRAMACTPDTMPMPPRTPQPRRLMRRITTTVA